jgi:mRNA interferase MazF
VERGLIRRGAIVTVALAGDYGKPRPALVVQSDLYQGHASVAVCPLTTEIAAAIRETRVAMAPDAINGLRAPSQAMIDKITVAPRGKIGAVIGEADEETMRRVTRALAVFLGVV